MLILTIKETHNKNYTKNTGELHFNQILLIRTTKVGNGIKEVTVLQGWGLYED